MCRSDVSLATYTYFKGTLDITARTWGKHQCVDYNALSAWVKGHAINIFEEGVLAKPEDLDELHFTENQQLRR